MTDSHQPHQLQVRPQRPYDVRGYGEHGLLGVKTQQHEGPSTGQVLTVITGLPVGGTLLVLAGLTLTGTIIGVLVATPLFIIFSPVLVPALFVIGLAVTGFLTSGAFGVTALSSLSWVITLLEHIVESFVTPKTLLSSMANRHQPHQLQVRPQRPYDVQGYGEHGLLGVKTQQHEGPSTGQVLAVITGLPVGGTLLALAGLTLTGTIIGVLVATPLFIIFSPVLVPALFVIGLAVTGFLTSGAFGVTALSSLSWVINYLRGATGLVQEQLGDMAEFVGQKTKEAGQDI